MHGMHLREQGWVVRHTMDNLSDKERMYAESCARFGFRLYCFAILRIESSQNGVP